MNLSQPRITSEETTMNIANSTPTPENNIAPESTVVVPVSAELVESVVQPRIVLPRNVALKPANPVSEPVIKRVEKVIGQPAASSVSAINIDKVVENLGKKLPVGDASSWGLVQAALV